jgi:hypothetical protein
VERERIYHVRQTFTKGGIRTAERTGKLFAKRPKREREIEENLQLEIKSRAQLSGWRAGEKRDR